MKYLIFYSIALFEFFILVRLLSEGRSYKQLNNHAQFSKTYFGTCQRNNTHQEILEFSWGKKCKKSPICECIFLFRTDKQDFIDCICITDFSLTVNTWCHQRQNKASLCLQELNQWACNDRWYFISRKQY